MRNRVPLAVPEIPVRSLLSALFLAIAPTLSQGVELIGPPAVEVSAHQAVIQWRTDVAAGTRLRISPSARVQPSDKTPATEHTATITALRPGVRYTVVVGTARLWLATNEFTVTSTTGIITPTPAAANLALLAAPPLRKIWGHPASLPDHFARHGGDFGARNKEDYARQAWEFLQRAYAEGLPAKRDNQGVLRLFDPQSGAFGSYNPDGTAKTFFKPGSPDYFERQPGEPIKLVR
jgi:hypothetical protein